MDTKSIGNTIAKLRKKHGMTQLQLAQRLNISDKTVSRWENGSALPDANNIFQLSKLFGVTADYLLNDDQDKTDDPQKQKDVFNKKRDIISLLTNIAIYPEQYKVSNETQKIARTLVKEHIKAAYVEINKHIKNNDIELSFGDFTTTTKDGSNYLEATKQLDTYLSNIYDIEDKNLLLLLIFIDIVGLLSIFLTLNIPILTGILVIILIIANILIFKNISNKQKVRKLEKQRKKEVLSISLEKVFAEITDYSNTLKENQLQYNNLEAYLNNLNVEDYIKNNEERNIIV